MEDVQDINSYFDRVGNRLYLLGLNKPITKEQFFKKVAEVPMVIDLLRAETFFKDRGYSYLKS
jgi:hypothetical protein